MTLLRFERKCAIIYNGDIMKTKSEFTSMLMVALSMLIFGTIGVFRKYIPLPSGTLALARATIGAFFLIAVVIVSRKKISFSTIKSKLPLLLISGALLGLNWILLFEAYNHTTVAAATLYYYMAPVIVIFLSPVFLKEKLTALKLVCVLLAIFGTILVSGIITQPQVSVLGMVLGLSAAMLHASVVILNKKIGEIDAFDKTIAQLIFAAVVLIPYVLISENIDMAEISANTVALLGVVGIVHTGVAYLLYFGAMDKLKAHTVALFSYIDPVFAIVLSAVILSEPLTVYEIIGAILILGSMILSNKEKV